MVNNKKGDIVKTVLITGGAGGIGKGVVDRISMCYRVIVGVHNEKQRVLVSNRYKDNSNISVIKLDLLSHSDIVSVCKYDIDVLICNAAVGYGGSLMEIDVSKVRESFDVNVFGNIELIQVVLKGMVSKNSGRVIIVSSLISFFSMPFLGAYSSSKAALNRIAFTLRRELGLLGSDVSVHLVLPGMYKTGFNDVMLENKYDLDYDSYFKYQIDRIRKKENFFWNLFQLRCLDSIVFEVVDCILYGDRFLYSAPMLHRLFAKLYSIIND